MDILGQLVAKALEASEHGYGTLSTGEAMASALTLDDHQWLATHQVSIADALARIGPEWAAQIPAAAQRVRKFLGEFSDSRREAERESVSRSLFALPDEHGPRVELLAELITHGCAPGYREFHATFRLQPLLGKQSNRPEIEATLRITAADGAVIARELIDIHRLAWREGKRPIDAEPDEKRPKWID